ncbi:helix-turn-helix domain-containing protein [Streptosporangium algeriense]|uniref:Helix-turn-helix domain-containing protein n=1 Tax=Streptosporangium algeriense TaxID=1682748 RepID=A0ABW3DP80_9ACTN
MGPDPEADYWTAEEVAEYLGVAVRTVYTYRLRGEKGEPGGLPKEDRMFGRSPAWRPATITGWKRPDVSTGRGRPPRRPTAEGA